MSLSLNLILIPTLYYSLFLQLYHTKSNTTTVQPTTCLGILACYVFFDPERYAGTLFNYLRDRKLGGPRDGLTLWQENSTTVLQLC